MASFKRMRLTIEFNTIGDNLDLYSSCLKFAEEVLNARKFSLEQITIEDKDSG